MMSALRDRTRCRRSVLETYLNGKPASCCLVTNAALCDVCQRHAPALPEFAFQLQDTAQDHHHHHHHYPVHGNPLDQDLGGDGQVDADGAAADRDFEDAFNQGEFPIAFSLSTC